MSGIHGIQGIPEPTPERPGPVRDRRREEVRGPAAEDGVEISAEAQEAANVRHLVEVARSQEEVRPERVAEAREGIERGDYRDPNIVREVARRLLRILFP